MENKSINMEINEKVLKPFSGMAMLLILILLVIASIAAEVWGIGTENVSVMIIAVLVFCVACLLFGGLKVINPNEALVLTIFGKYYGTIKSHGFFFVNPFVTVINQVA